MLEEPDKETIAAKKIKIQLSLMEEVIWSIEVQFHKDQSSGI